MEITLHRQEHVQATFLAPPSKSDTHRALVVAALAKGRSRIDRPLHAGDTRVTERGLRRFGVQFQREKETLLVEGTAGHLTCLEGCEVDVKDSGTSMRFLTSVSLLCGSPVILWGSKRMHERPIGDLVTGLNQLGGTITYLGKPGYPPLRVSGSLIGGSAEIPSLASSQYLSSILLVAPCAERDVTLNCPESPVSRSYVDMTLRTMERFGVPVDRTGYRSFTVHAGKGYTAQEYQVEGDYSSASYFAAIPAVCMGSVRVRGLDPESCQGDRLFLRALEKMGCQVQWNDREVEIARDGPLRGIHIDMSAAPDSVQTLCMVAACASSPTTITGVRHLRWKESDRLQVTADHLRLLGARVEVAEDAITIFPGPLRGGVVNPNRDHRTAMSFAILGLAVGGIHILQAECVDKSFPGFWEQLAREGFT
jgi:3-phosphoshikimate 1-carboxyvinyltransferase